MTSYTAFFHDRRLAHGTESDIAAAIRSLPDADASDVLVFEDLTGRQTDIDWRGSRAAADSSLARMRGRPSLGVVAREVTLLPRHWEWLASQRAGASATLRRLVDEARKRDTGDRAAADAAFRFLTATAGDRPNYEEAVRKLFAGDRAGFERYMDGWPADIREHALRLAYGG